MILTHKGKDLAKRIDKAVFPGLQGGPHMHIIAAKAVAFKEALAPSFKTYATQVLSNAKAMEVVFKDNNIRLITGGTDNHLLLADVYGSLGITGQAAETVLDEVGITLNKNMIADDPRSPMNPSGIRFGTPALTTRGMKEKEATRLAEIMIATMKAEADTSTKAKLQSEVREICTAFPVPESFI